VGIASYCDAELDLTLTQLFAKAHDPSRVYVGLVLQERIPLALPFIHTFTLNPKPWTLEP
jgi:hypothetical protein